MTPTQYRILRYVWRKGETTRGEMSRDLSLNLSTITRNLRPLLKKSVIHVTGYVSSGGFAGRKSELIGINGNWRKIVGVSVDRRGVVALLVNIKGEILRKSVEIELVSSENILEVIKSVLEKILEEDVIAVSVGIPGIVDEGKVVFSEALNLRDFEMRANLEASIGKKVYVMNDANAAVANFSESSQNTLCFLLTIPYDLREKVGLGAGLWINGRLYLGFHGAAGETGEGVPLMKSGSATIEDLKTGVLRIEDLNLREYEEWLVGKTVLLTNFIDPEVLILAGDVSIIPEDLMGRILSRVSEGLLMKPDLRLDRNGRETVARGATLALLNEIMTNIDMFNEYME